MCQNQKNVHCVTKLINKTKSATISKLPELPIQRTLTRPKQLLTDVSLKLIEQAVKL